MKFNFAAASAGLICLLGITAPQSASAAKICVFDIVGKNGPAFGFAKDYALAASQWGAPVEVEAYTDERLAAEDFKIRKCDGVAITALRARQFNSFVGSIDAVGAVPSYTHLKALINLLSSPKSSALMSEGDYEVVGIIPVGAAYVHVNNKEINSIEKASGKRVAVLDYDKSQARMVQQLGAQPVASEVINFGTKFNNGQVDVVVAPAVAYKPLELYKGLGKNGGIYRFPLVQLTADIVIDKTKFPAGFGEKSRDYVAKRFDLAIQTVEQAEKQVDKGHWLDIPKADEEKYKIMMKEARIQLTTEGFYNKKMMTLLKKLRCQLDGKLAECADKSEIY